MNPSPHCPHRPPALELIPAGQFVQAPPLPDEDLPAGHAEHDESPAAVVYPAGQGTHLPPDTDVKPTGQLVQGPPWPSEVCPAGQYTLIPSAPTT